MTIQQLGETHRVRVRRDECGDYYIVGKYGQIYEYDPTALGVMVSAKTGHRWKEARREMLAAGFQHNQNGDCEGSCVFPADDSGKLKLALKLIRAFKSRKGQVVSEKARSAGLVALAEHRLKRAKGAKVQSL